jgi:putative ABC transport system permease protein
MTHLILRLVRRAATLLHLRAREHDMDEEMRFHLEMEAGDLVRSGLPADLAEREARLRFGGVDRHKEDGRDARGVRLIENLGQDLRYALRQAVHAPAFTIATLLTLGLSVGASTFMYSFATMSPVPFDHPDRLLYVRQFSRTGCPNCQLVSTGNALALAANSRALEAVAFVSGPSATALRRADRSEVARATAVTYQFFNITGMHTILGRTFLPSDTLPGAVPVVMISEPAWRSRFGADSSLVGRDIVLDGRHRIVRGIIAQNDVYPERTDIWTSQTLSASELNDHSSNLNYLTIARLRDGATLAQASAEAATVSRGLAADFPDDFRTWQLDVRPLRLYGGGSDEDKKIFTAAAGFVLAIACINLAGLLLARLTRRRRELAVRAAMGAHAARLARQLLTETVIVCAAAGVVGILSASVGIKALIAAVPESVAPPGFTRFGLDARAALFAIVLATACGLVIALLPSLRFARPQLHEELRDGARSHAAHGASGGERVRRALVVLELALSVVLLAAAGLLLRSQANIARAPVGLAPDHVLTFRVQLPTEIDGKRVETVGYFDLLANELARLPGVTSAGGVAFLPLGGSGWSSSMFQVQGRPPLEGSGGTRTQVATPGYFRTLKIPMLGGRAFTDADADTARRVAVVNETLARRFFPNDSPIGRVLVLANGARLTVVGIVADVKQRGVLSDAGQEIIMPAATTSRRSITIVVHTVADPAELTQAIMKATSSFDPNLAIDRVRTMDAVVGEYLAASRVGQVAMMLLAGIAILIATMGLYAIMSYTVASRTREFGVRLALGASGSSLVGLVLEQGLRLATAGIVIGVAAALATMRMMQARLFQVGASDPLTLGLVVAGMFAVAIAAGLVPARRALTVDPVSSLKAE